MADGIKSGIQNMMEQIPEAVMKPVTDEVGMTLEAAGQSISGNYQDPPTSQQKQNNDTSTTSSDVDPQKIANDDARKKQNVLKFLEQLKQQEQQSLHMQKMAEMQKKQSEVQVEQQEKQEEVFEKQQKNEDIQTQRNQTRAERKLGVGG